MEILHRLEVQESVSIEELAYLQQQAIQYPEVATWIIKLLGSNESREDSLVDVEKHAA